MDKSVASLTHLQANEIASWLSALSPSSNLPMRQQVGGNLPPHSHVFYGSAARFRADTFQKMRDIAISTWGKFFPAAQHLHLLDDRFSALPPAEQTALHAKIGNKLRKQPIESFRIDFEDGLGPCDDAQEDVLAQNAASELHAALHDRPGHDDDLLMPREVGIRIRAFQTDTAVRAIRTLDIFLSRWNALGAPQHQVDFRVTLPKVEGATEIRILCTALDRLETEFSWAKGTIGVEIMVESPALLFPGSAASDSLEEALAAGSNRVRSVHFGVYDFLSAAHISAPHQCHDHPLAARARAELLLRTWSAECYAVDGATHEMPIGPHRATPDRALAAQEDAENRAVIEHALKLHAQNVLRALDMGLYCGWDLHPVQLIARWSSVHAFLRTGLNGQLKRVLSYLERAKKADRTGAYFDDAASAQGVFHFFRHGWQAGAIDRADLQAAGCSDAQIALLCQELALGSTQAW